MLGENIRNLRKKKGYSQEMVAEKLNIVRQTVSKWEKGYSVPDAEMLERIAELFEVSVGDLLGGSALTEPQVPEMGEIARQLAFLNDQLARQSRARKRAWKIAGIVFGSLIGLVLAGILSCTILFGIRSVKQTDEMRMTYELLCTLDGEEYMYTIVCDEQYRILEAGGDAWVANHVQVEKYSDANILMAQIEDYFEDRGGTCEIAKIVSSDKE